MRGASPRPLERVRSSSGNRTHIVWFKATYNSHYTIEPGCITGVAPVNPCFTGTYTMLRGIIYTVVREGVEPTLYTF